ncbi:MAG: phosphotransferase [Pirellulales bacterium]
MSHANCSNSSLPADIEDALRSVAALQGKPLVVTQLTGGITNRNFRIDADAETFVLRVAGPGTEQLGIDRQREYLCAQAAAASGAGCEVVAFLPEHGAMLSRYAPGAPLSPRDSEDASVLARAVGALTRFHAAGTLPGRFCPFRTVESYLEIARRHGVLVPAEVDAVLARLAVIEAQLADGSEISPCHNDLLPANLIDDGQQVRIIDWEYAAMGDRFFDLGNLAENHELSAAAESNLLALYFCEVRPRDRARLRMMRTASAMREAAWGFVQAGVSTLDFDFHGYARRHLDIVVQRLSAHPDAEPQLPA